MESTSVAVVLVDTDVLIEVLRARDEKVVNRWKSFVTESLPAYSPITAAELGHGVRPAEIPTLEAMLGGMTCIPCDGETGHLAGQLLLRFQRSHSLELPDAFIAATAIQHGLPLWTRNRKHYPMRELRLL